MIRNTKTHLILAFFFHINMENFLKSLQRPWCVYRNSYYIVIGDDVLMYNFKVINLRGGLVYLRCLYFNPGIVGSSLTYKLT